LAIACVFLLVSTSPAQDGVLTSAVLRLTRLVPADPAGYVDWQVAPLRQAAQDLDALTAAREERLAFSAPEQILPALRDLELAQSQVSALVQKALARRWEIAEQLSGPQREQALRHYLEAMLTLFDASGRMNYELVEAYQHAARICSRQPSVFGRLIDEALARKSRAGASVLSWALLDAPPGAPAGTPPASNSTKFKLLQFLGEMRPLDARPVLAEFLFSKPAMPELTVYGVEVLRVLGLPQDPRPNSPPTTMVPEILASEVHDLLGQLDANRMSPEWQKRHADLRTWLERRMKEGTFEDSLFVGEVSVRPGDWLLQRNPSPYNQFTTLSPSLFTHVGMIARETGADGKQRIVVVEMRERGTNIPATNVDLYLPDISHYVIVRETDPEAAKVLARVAREVINNPMEFDLTFETSRVLKLRGQTLPGQKIHTYCAGLLLIGAQETSYPREAYFPVSERAYGELTLANLSVLGMKIGEDFISPTGPLFSRRMQLVGWHEPFYHAGREIEQAIYDKFSVSLRARSVAPTPDLFQSLRVKMAELARTNPLLAQALAMTAGVNADIDLVSAAKAVAVVETLDEIAQGQSRDYELAFAAVRGGTPEQLAQAEFSPDDVKKILTLRARYADLRQQVQAGTMSARALRQVLLSDAIRRGEEQIERRFFSTTSQR